MWQLRKNCLITWKLAATGLGICLVAAWLHHRRGIFSPHGTRSAGKEQIHGVIPRSRRQLWVCKACESVSCVECVGKGVCIACQLSGWSCDVGGGLPIRLLLESPAEMLNASFLSHNDNHQDSIGSWFIAYNRRVEASIDGLQCVITRQGATRVRQRCQYQEASHGKLIFSGPPARANHADVSLRRACFLPFTMWCFFRD
jgi:hypothetical protein